MPGLIAPGEGWLRVRVRVRVRVRARVGVGVRARVGVGVRARARARARASLTLTRLDGSVERAKDLGCPNPNPHSNQVPPRRSRVRAA